MSTGSCGVALIARSCKPALEALAVVERQIVSTSQALAMLPREAAPTAVALGCRRVGSGVVFR